MSCAENLDLSYSFIGHEQAISGSVTVQKLREEIDDSTESRHLALIRSANDSATDMEIYKHRAHGFMAKEPIKKNEVLDVIKPWWDAQFPRTQALLGNDSTPEHSLNDAMDYVPSADDIEE